MSPPLLLGERWKEALHLQHRSPPDFFERNREVRSTLYAPAVQIGFRELGLSAVFCVNGVPTVAIRRSREYEPTKTHEIRSALWNQGLASIYVDIVDTTNTVRIFSLARGQSSDSGAASDDKWLIETINATTDAVRQLHSYVTGAESGRIWRECSEFFPADQRIDAVLLNNLTVGHDTLLEMKLSTNEAQAALIQTMFIAYLEDRELISDLYFRSATDGKFASWNSLLASGNIVALQRLFVQLRSDFNGDMFLTPCSFLESQDTVLLTPQHLEVLMRFRIGREVMSQTHGGQIRFWGYNFRYIPIELISAVYDRFLRRMQESSKLKGAYYTPMFLADAVVSSMWDHLTDAQKQNGRFFDPACGSGIFLVKIFQRLCQHQIETWSDDAIPFWDTLLTTLDRVRGHDDNPAAVRIAAFSLYLALLEQATRGRADNPLNATQRLPNLRDRVVATHDFFDADCPEHKTDVIIGNPPWSSRRSGYPPAIRWTKENDCPFPGKEIAWAFTWKALRQLNEGGVLAFLVPTMGFLHNQANSSIRARSRLFRDSQVRVVVDFSDLRRLLFPSSTRSTSLIIARKPTSESTEPYIFEYFTPKANLNLFARRIITLSNDDRKWIRSYEIEQNSLALKQQLWIRAPESGLFKYLSQLPTLGGYLRKVTRRDTPGEYVVCGEGFQPLRNQDSQTKAKISDVLHRIPYLPSRSFAPLKMNLSGLSPWPSREVRRLGFEAGFFNPRTLVTTGVSTKHRRLRAAYVERPLSFQDAVLVISSPEERDDVGKFLTAILNSRLAIWFAFHGTKTFGAERPEVALKDLMRLPLPMPSDLSDSVRADEIYRQLVQAIDDFVPSRFGEQEYAAYADVALKGIDQLTYHYFGLSRDEIAMVEETVDCVLPAVQPSSSMFPNTWRHSTLSDRRSYSDTLVRRLSRWFSDGLSLGIRLFSSNADYAILEVSISPDEADPYTENGMVSFPEAIVELQANCGRPITGNFCIALDVRVFVGSKLYLVKPLQKRYWLHGSALADAGAIVSDLQAAWQESRKERGVS